MQLQFITFYTHECTEALRFTIFVQCTFIVLRMHKKEKKRERGKEEIQIQFKTISNSTTKEGGIVKKRRKKMEEKEKFNLPLCTLILHEK